MPSTRQRTTPPSNKPREGAVIAETSAPTFIDAFAGCGGLSLGLIRAGWRELFAIEKDAFAFETFEHNILMGRYEHQIRWPSWMPREPTCIAQLLNEHSDELIKLRGTVTMLAGGPPCQGFSSAGRRRSADPRNQLVEAYLRLVTLIRPEIVLLENVKWIAVPFRSESTEHGLIDYASRLKDALSADYDTFDTVLDTADYGVPQSRRRYVLIAIRRANTVGVDTVGTKIESARRHYLRRHGLVVPVSAVSALSDLEVNRNGTEPSVETSGFSQTSYSGPRSTYQALMRDGFTGAPPDLRLANHRADIRQRFADIIAECIKDGRLNTSLGPEMRGRFGLRKLALRVLDPHRPAPTVTSMPDDLLHYAEPRTLTVRENARLQSFPDWFEFRGKYTTGGDRRRHEVPRFTQVANAVPPVLAEILGDALMVLYGNLPQEFNGQKSTLR